MSQAGALSSGGGGITTPVSVPNGGTGNTSFTPFTVILAGATSISPLTNVVNTGMLGQILTSNGPGVQPTWQTAAGGGNVTAGANIGDNRIVRGDGGGTNIQDSLVTIGDLGEVSGITQLDVDNIRIDGNTISSTNANGNINITPNGAGNVVVPNLVISSVTGVLTGNGAAPITGSLITEGAVLLAGAANAVTDTGVLAKGSMIIGDGVAAPTILPVGTDTFVLTADAAAPSGVKWAVTAGAGFVWQEITGTTQALAINNGYICNAAGLMITCTLPATSAIGDIIELTGKGACLFTIAQGAGQSVRFGELTSTVGAGGSMVSTNGGDWLRLVCITANTAWMVQGTGNITVN